MTSLDRGTGSGHIPNAVEGFRLKSALVSVRPSDVSRRASLAPSARARFGGLYDRLAAVGNDKAVRKDEMLTR